MKLTAKHWTVDPSYDALYDFACEQEWTDGLPIVPPTEDRVMHILQGIQRDPQEVVGILPPRNGMATVEKIAINAVMAGCKPEYMPIVVTSVEALAQPEMNLLSIQTTTNPVAPLAIVHGPITERVGMNAGANVLGPGNRANATIGRTIRLILINIGGGVSGVADNATHGQPGKYTSCIAEHWRENPWTPLHVDQGFDPTSSAVTIFPTPGTEEVAVRAGVTEPEEILLFIANAMTRWGGPATTGLAGPFLLLLAVGHARLSFDARGWTKRDIQEFLFQHARIHPQALPDGTMEFWARMGRNPVRYSDGKICPVRSPEDIHVVVAGGHQATIHFRVAPGGSNWGVMTKLIPEQPGGKS